MSRRRNSFFFVGIMMDFILLAGATFRLPSALEALSVGEFL